jgi:hypothetical protein
MRLPMANELDPGAAYLASLKRSSSAPAPTPTRSTEAAASSETTRQGGGPSFSQRPQVTEKRRSPRYRCQGSARLHEIGSPASVWATFTDISMHGCYVEAPDPFHVGAILKLRLESRGFRIEAIGEVRVAYPGVGMGISFGEMSEQDNAQLRELVQSISRPSMILNSRVVTRSLGVPAPDPRRAVKNPAAALQAIFSFFETRHILGREEFLRIIRTSQEHEK